MNYLTFEHISKSYGEKFLFQDISLTINKGQKIALIARNGSGKTSLLRVLAGQESAEGEKKRILVHPSVRIGYLEQNPHFLEHETVLEAALKSPSDKVEAVRAYENALLFGDNAQIEKAVEVMESRKAWDTEAKIKEILSRLALEDWKKTIDQLSGGQKKRLALARLLIDEPDFLILDEPTNHLDLEMIEWLEQYLQGPNLTLLLVTHDRYFMERICDTIIELEQAQLYKYQGNYADYLEKKSIRQANDAIQHDKNTKLLKTELEWVRRQPKARGTKAKSRIHKFEELRGEVLGFSKEQEIEMEISAARLGSKIAELQYISKAFDDRILFKDFHYKFQKKDRVGVVGPNGSGKTTFLSILTKQIPPDSGKVVIGDTVQFGYYTQDGIILEQDKRCIDVVREIAEYIPLSKGRKLTAASLLERFMFPRSQQQVYVSQLSGGEKRRLHLITILMKNPNFLILDEPTNDLDIFTLNALEDYLMDFPGCLVIVSHDRFFMDKLVNHLFVFEGNGLIRDFPGNYSDYRNSGPLESTIPEPVEKEEIPKQDDREARKALKRLERKMINIEKEMADLEIKKKKIELQFLQPLEAEQIKDLSTQLSEIKEEIDAKEMEWMEWGEKIEAGT